MKEINARFRLDQSFHLLLAGVQWLFFLFINTVVVPLSIGHALELAPAEIAAAMQRSFILTGVLCIIQVLWGHRYALMDGPAGLWWGVVLQVCATAPVMGIELGTAAASLVSGFLLSGAIVIGMVYCGLMPYLQRLFSPLVMTVFLLLLAFQLEKIFFEGMIGQSQSGQWDLRLSGLSIAVVLVVVLFHIKGKGRWGQFSLLAGIVFGWIGYTLLFGGQVADMQNINGQAALAATEGTTGKLWQWMPWGLPGLQPGIIAVGLITGLLNMSNTFTTLVAVGKIYGQESSSKQYKRSFLFTNGFTIIGACFGLIPFGTFASSIGFLENTRIIKRSALVVGSLMFVTAGLVPLLSDWLSRLPLSVGHAVLFAAYLQLLGTGIRSLQQFTFSTKTIYRIAIPVCVGVSIMTLPQSAFAGLPPSFIPLVSNGLIVGLLLVLILEHGVRWENQQ